MKWDGEGLTGYQEEKGSLPGRSYPHLRPLPPKSLLIGDLGDPVPVSRPQSLFLLSESTARENVGPTTVGVTSSPGSRPRKGG